MLARRHLDRAKHVAVVIGGQSVLALGVVHFGHYFVSRVISHLNC